MDADAFSVIGYLISNENLLQIVAPNCSPALLIGVSALTPINNAGEQLGATIYNKFSLEMRYPITLKASASIYALAFLEAGSSYDSFKNYNPFALNRSAC